MLHVGIIMDGNGRWAKEKGLSRSLGHKKGADNLLKLIPYIFSKGIKYISIYAFSKENFNRNKEEVDYLMNLFLDLFNKSMKRFKKDEIKIVFSGEKTRLRNDVIKSMEKLEEETKVYENKILNICLSYSGREEIVDSFKKIYKDIKENRLDINNIDEEVVSKYMYQNLPDLDLVIRTSGEQRISNFMLWQSSYAEYVFPKTYFPAFDNKEFDKVLEEYESRERRFGGNEKK